MEPQRGDTTAAAATAMLPAELSTVHETFGNTTGETWLRNRIQMDSEVRERGACD